MAQNHDTKFDAAAAQLLGLKENLYGRCCEDTIEVSNSLETKGTKLLGGQEFTNISKNVGSQLQTIEKYIAGIGTWPGYLIFRSRVLAVDSSLIITTFSDGWYRDNYDPHGAQHTTNRMVLMRTQEIENVMSKNHINLVYHRR